jgi:DNA-binding NarL/FixJ family response regulator
MGAGPVTRPTILVVDDHSGFRATARRLLERDGWSVVGEAEDGRDALAATAALEPDVVLLDIGLPDIDGFDVAERIAQIGDAPSIVLISSRDQEAYHDRVQRSPAAGLIAKDKLDGMALRLLLAGARP